MIKRRGKFGLIKVGVDLEGVKEWLKNKLGREFEVRFYIYKNEDKNIISFIFKLFLIMKKYFYCERNLCFIIDIVLIVMIICGNFSDVLYFG